jgi:hypothetical protein
MKRNITRAVFDVYDQPYFSRHNEVGLIVGHDIVLCHGRGKPPIGK